MQGEGNRLPTVRADIADDPVRQRWSSYRANGLGQTVKNCAPEG